MLEPRVSKQDRQHRVERNRRPEQYADQFPADFQRGEIDQRFGAGGALFEQPSYRLSFRVRSVIRKAARIFMASPFLNDAGSTSLSG